MRIGSGFKTPIEYMLPKLTIKDANPYDTNFMYEIIESDFGII